MHGNHMRFSRAKPTGSYRVFQPTGRRVAEHAETLQEARKSAEYWVKAVGGTFEIQRRFPSGTWTVVDVVGRKSSSRVAKNSNVARARAHAAKRSSHAEKKPAGDKTNIADLAKMFGLPDWDKIDDQNQQHYWESARGADDVEAAEQEAQMEVYRKWYDAVESAASKLFEEHGLELEQTGKKDRSFDLKIIPSKSWDDAANKIRATINGVGDFRFDTLKEFLGSGPYTAKKAVLSHLGYIRQQPKVYGGSSAKQLFEQAW